MEERTSFITWVERQSSNKDLLLIPVTSSAEMNLLAMENGVILFHAGWSGYSYENMASIFQALRESKFAPKTVAICWYEGFTAEEITSILGAMCHGYAESVLVRNGEVVAHFHRKPDLEPFLQTIREQI
jgi:hypothetical protein